MRRAPRYLLAVAAAAVTLMWMGAARGPAAPSDPLSYGRWKHGPSADPAHFPIGVWLQSPRNAPRFQKAGINTYVGLWQGPTEEQLAALKAAGMRVVCAQNEVGLKHRDDPTIVGWMHGDEPDNAQPLPGGRGYGEAIHPDRIIADYQRIRAADSTRPVLLNLGQGVANDAWRGRGAKRYDYREYCKGADIVSFDVYPVVGIGRPDGENYLWYVPRGLDRLKEATDGGKLLWNVVECTRIDEPEKKATPPQVKAEVWMSLIHGSRGIVYFVHQFKPRFIEAALLEDPDMLAAVTAINQQIRELAPALNSPSLPDAATVTTTTPSVPVDVMAKRHGKGLYVFAVGMRNGATQGRFTLKGAGKARVVTVIGENRTLPLRDGRFEDDFAPYAVHLYRIEER
jgi:hypothetical protein